MNGASNNGFLEFTIVSDSADNVLVVARKGIVLASTIVAVTDVSSGGYMDRGVTRVTTSEAVDYVDDDTKKGGVVHRQREITVQEQYAEVKRMLGMAT